MSYPQYTQQYVVAPAPATTQTYAAPAPAYDPQAYSAAPAQPYQSAPAPHYAPAPQYGAPAYNRDELRTIFVTGFPPDMKERELTNMCRFLPGFEAVSMKASTHGAPQGFVLFQYGHNAMHACTCLNGCEFDAGAYLRAEMARKNMYVRGGDERPAKAYRADGPGGGPGPGPGAPGGGGGHPPYGAPPSGGAPAGGSFADRNQTNPPCNTLFIGNLSPHVDDAAIESYFRNVKGDAFVTCKVNRSNPSRVSAFVQFADLAAAAEVHDGQQGKEMPGSDRGPMRIQYSRNPLGEFGKRRREEAAAGGGGGFGYGAPPAMHMAAAPHHGGGTPTPGADGGQYAVAPADGGAGVGYAAPAATAPPGQLAAAAPPVDYSHAPPPQQPQ